jgi:hypothetical protein
MGGVLISVGDHRTRKKDVIERMMRQELTAEAKELIEKRKMKEAEERGEADREARKRAEEAKEEAEAEEIKKEWKKVPLLPKKLLGKAEDNREPSLPQKSRRSTDLARSKNSLDSGHKSRRSTDLAMSKTLSDPARRTRSDVAVPAEPAAPPATRSWKDVIRKPVPQSSSTPATTSASSSAPRTTAGPSGIAPTSAQPPQRIIEIPQGPEAVPKLEQGKRDRFMKMVRRADLDRS